MRMAWLIGCAIVIAPAAYADPLTFADAVARASQDAPNVAARRARAEAADLLIGPAGQLPDPQLVLGLENVPVEGPDAYRLDRDEMTMQTIGVMQDMPSGAERRARRAVAGAEAERAEAGLDIARLEARLGAAQAWIRLYYAERRIALLNRLADEARAGAEAARARLAGGAGSVDAAIGAEVEAARVADRLADAEAGVSGLRAELRRWVGALADEPLASAPPSFAIDPQLLRAALSRHPGLLAVEAETAMAEANLGLARAERAPDWSWTAMYQRRDDAFGDMAGIEVRVGLPLFQPWRQGPVVEARRAERTSVAAERLAAERELAAVLESALAEYAATEANLARARDVHLPRARQSAEAASGAFSAGTVTALDMIAARREALEAELDLIGLEERHALIGAGLTLQYAEVAP